MSKTPESLLEIWDAEEINWQARVALSEEFPEALREAIRQRDEWRDRFAEHGNKFVKEAQEARAKLEIAVEALERFIDYGWGPDLAEEALKKIRGEK